VLILNALVIVISILYMLGCIALVTMILLQKKRSAGMGGGMAGMGQSNTYWDKNKGRSREGMLEKYTKIGIAAFLVITAVTWFIRF